jgi:hypothetical protein
MNPYPTEKQTLACAHWRSFPPRSASLTVPIEEARAKGLIDDAEYSRYRIWDSICGLKEILPEKCLGCPHVRVASFDAELPVLVTLDGKEMTPTVDLPSLEVSARHRKILSLLRRDD